MHSPLDASVHSQPLRVEEQCMFVSPLVRALRRSPVERRPILSLLVVADSCQRDAAPRRPPLRAEAPRTFEPTEPTSSAS